MSHTLYRHVKTGLDGSGFLSRRVARAGGFTLIEMLVVMVIIAIAFAAIRPELARTLKASQDRAALRKVIAMLTGAHAKAVIEGRLVRVTISPSDGAMWAEIQVDPTVDRTQFAPISVLGKQQLLWPKELSIDAMNIGGTDSSQSGEAVIYFYPDGRTSGADFAFEGSAGHTYQVDLSPATGRVQISA